MQDETIAKSRFRSGLIVDKGQFHTKLPEMALRDFTGAGNYWERLRKRRYDREDMYPGREKLIQKSQTERNGLFATFEESPLSAPLLRFMGEVGERQTGNHPGADTDQSTLSPVDPY